MDLRIEFADTDFTRRKTSDSLAGVWYNNTTFTNGMRQYGFPLGHHMGTDAIDFFVRATRYVFAEDWQLGSNLDYQERAGGCRCMRKARVRRRSHLVVFSADPFCIRLHLPAHSESGQMGPCSFCRNICSGMTSRNDLFWTDIDDVFLGSHSGWTVSSLTLSEHWATVRRRSAMAPPTHLWRRHP